MSDLPPVPFVHTVTPSYWHHPSGAWVPCDGPTGLALSEDNELLCATCRTKVHRTTEEPRHA